jgi:hypothetical protein
MLTASTRAVGPSYSDAFEASRPVRSQIIDWYSNSAWRIPCDSSGWYGVYEVCSSDLPASAHTTDGT